MDDPLTEDDRRMLADLNARARRIQATKILQWTLVLVPGIPAVMLGIFLAGVFVGGPLSVAATVAWALLVQKMVPVRELV